MNRMIDEFIEREETEDSKTEDSYNITIEVPLSLNHIEVDFKIELDK